MVSCDFLLQPVDDALERLTVRGGKAVDQVNIGFDVVVNLWQQVRPVFDQNISRTKKLPGFRTADNGEQWDLSFGLYEMRACVPVN